MNQFLSDASRIAIIDVETASALQRVARTTVPVLADFCLVYLLQREQLRCVAFTHRNRAGQRVLQALVRVYRITRDDPGSTVAQVVRTRRPSLRAAIPPENDVETTRGSSPRVAALHRRLGARSALVVPLEDPAGVIGALALSYAESGRRYTAASIVRATKIARHMALLVRHAPLLTLMARQERMLSRMLDPRHGPFTAPLLRTGRLRARS
jgi:GAF domain-containing protein